MTAASRMTYLGAAFFAGAAGVAALAAMVVHDVPHPDNSFSETIWVRSFFALAAILSAVVAFFVSRYFDWRLRCEPLFGRAFVVGGSTVVIAHLLIGAVCQVLLGVLNLVWPEQSLFGRGGDLLSALGMSVFSVVYGWYLTLPLGIAAAALVEWLVRRREAASPSSSTAKAAE
ncbi:hypothetical protein [Pelagibius sp. 7325]|uniref:hypothetical protein n=1 Tax=Pelagibius sp. 7325 TaxID=3131994 RepID=UPI0030EC236A